MKKNPYGSEQTFKTAEQERLDRNKQLGQVNAGAAQTRDIANTTAGAVNPALERFYDPTGAGMSAWKKGQIQTRTGATTQAFNSSLAGSRRRAALSGFGYEQPAEQAGETNIENERSRALSRIPGDVEAEAVPIEMQAIGQRLASGAEQAGTFGQVANTELGVAGQYSPESYYQTAAQQQEAEKARKLAWFKSIGQLGLGLATGPFGLGAKAGS